MTRLLRGTLPDRCAGTCSDKFLEKYLQEFVATLLYVINSTKIVLREGRNGIFYISQNGNLNRNFWNKAIYWKTVNNSIFLFVRDPRAWKQEIFWVKPSWFVIYFSANVDENTFSSTAFQNQINLQINLQVYRSDFIQVNSWAKIEHLWRPISQTMSILRENHKSKKMSHLLIYIYTLS